MLSKRIEQQILDTLHASARVDFALTAMPACVPLTVKGSVIADEGKIKVTSAGQPLPEEVLLRIKGSKQATGFEQNSAERPGGGGSGTSSPPHGSENGGGFQVGEEEIGIVVAHHGSRVIVERLDHEGTWDERISCGLTPLLKEKGILTGDKIRFRASLEGDMVASNNTAARKGIVTDRLERTTLLERPAKAFAELDMGDVVRGGDDILAAGGGTKLMCANVDQMLIVISPRPLTPPLLLDSHIVAAVNSGIEPVVVLNKCDLLEKGEVQRAGEDANGVLLEGLPDLCVYEALGYPGVCVCVCV
jgi:hypothetical protein